MTLNREVTSLLAKSLFFAAATEVKREKELYASPDIPISVVWHWQGMLVSGWGLILKQRSALPCGPCGWSRDFMFLRDEWALLEAVVIRMWWCRSVYLRRRFGLVGNVVRRISEVNQRRTRLVLGWVTVSRRVNHLGMWPATRVNSAWPSLRS